MATNSTERPLVNSPEYVPLVGATNPLCSDPQELYERYDKALRNFDWKELYELIDAGADYLRSIKIKHVSKTFYFDATKKDETNALYLCTGFNRNDIVKLIVSKHNGKSEVEREAYDYQIPFASQCADAILYICENNNWKLLELLVGAMEDAYVAIDRDQIPRKAATYGHWKVLDELKKCIPELDFDLKPKKGKNRPLYLASKYGHIHTINWLLDNCETEKNKIVNNTNEAGNTALHIACQDADDVTVQLLIKRGADINATNNEGETPVLFAARIGNASIIYILAKEKAFLDQRDDSGKFPLLLACVNGHTSAISELIANGATIKTTNDDRFNCLESAIHSRKDGSAAMCVRLYPSDNFLAEYCEYFEIPLMDIVKYGLIETVNAFLDRMVVAPADKDKDSMNIKGKVLTKYFDLNSKNVITTATNDTYFLLRITQFGNKKLSYHGSIRLLVDDKMRKFGNYFLFVQMLFYILFLLTLAYSLVQASYQQIPRDDYTSDFWNILRLIAELFTVLYFIINIVTELAELFRVAYLAREHLQSKKHGDQFREIKKAEVATKWRKFKKSIKNLNNSFIMRVISDYLSDKSNYWDVLGLLSLLILFVLRIASHPLQWIFAPITFFINSIRLFKLIVLIPVLGPYSTIIYKVLLYDVPKFAALFLITLFIYTCTFFVALRAPFTIEGLSNASVPQGSRAEGIDDQFWWVLFSGLRILLEGNIYEEERANYIFNSLNFLAAIFYMTFLFLTVVVYLNVFIAQLTDTYAYFKLTSDHVFAWHRLKYIIQIQRTSLLSNFMKFRKQYFKESIEIDKDELFEYYGVNDIKYLNMRSFNEDRDNKTMLSAIQSQQKGSEKTKNVLEKFHEEENKIEKRFDKIDRRIDEILERLSQVITVQK